MGLGAARPCLAVGMLSCSSLSCGPQCQPLHEEVSHTTGRQVSCRSQGTQHARVVLGWARYPPWASRGLPRLKPEDIRCSRARSLPLSRPSSLSLQRPVRPAARPLVAHARAPLRRLGTRSLSSLPFGGCVGSGRQKRAFGGTRRPDSAADPVLCDTLVAAEVARGLCYVKLTCG